MHKLYPKNLISTVKNLTNYSRVSLICDFKKPVISGACAIRGKGFMNRDREKIFYV